MKFSIKDLFSKWDQIRSFLRIWSHLLKKSLMENLFFVPKKDEILFHLEPKFQIKFYWEFPGCFTSLVCLSSRISLIICNHWLFHDGGPYRTETSSSICSANQRTGLYMIGISTMKESNRINPNTKDRKTNSCKFGFAVQYFPPDKTFFSSFWPPHIYTFRFSLLFSLDYQVPQIQNSKRSHLQGEGIVEIWFVN